ncbi:LrgB family protein [Bacillus cereus group sp. BfR-BA-01380]|uniref:LrgB family protein n=1 Tax=Bacillus cereus group sp. BfR-BA-01380 TaxID=2920324 RepID=UPI001F57128C|nr:LrgB family protein [Bacillus cereus group sp. BfR-BA-01380]
MIGLLCFSLTLFTYWISKKIYIRWKWSILSPLLICPIILIFLLHMFQAPYETYESGGQWLTKLLKPATVAFAWPIYKYFYLLKKHASAILINVIVGSFLSVITSALLANWLQINPSLEHSLAPHIVTTPIAMAISEMIGGMSQLTAVFVVLTALTGALFGPMLIKLCRIKTSIAKGIMLGTSANGTGTSKAFEIGPVEGTIASLAMLLTAGASLILVPLLLPWLH